MDQLGSPSLPDGGHALRTPDNQHANVSRGGVVTIDVLLFRDGSLDRSRFEMLKAVGPKTTTRKPESAR